MVDGWLVPCPPPTPSPWLRSTVGWTTWLGSARSSAATGEKQELLVGLSRVIARAQAEQLRVLATADDVAEATGDRSTASWLATATRDAPGRVRADARLAAALDQRWTQTARRRSRPVTLNLAQARVICRGVRGTAQGSRRGPAGQGRDAAGHRGRPARAPGAADLRVPHPGVPGPRHRRRGRLPAAPGPGTPSRRGHPADPAPPRRRVHRPARPHPRPRPPACCAPSWPPSPPPAATTSHRQGDGRDSVGPLTAPIEDEFAQPAARPPTGHRVRRPPRTDPQVRPAPPRRQGHLPGRADRPRHPARRPDRRRDRPDQHRGEDDRRPGPTPGLPGRPRAAVLGTSQRGPRPRPRVPTLQAPPNASPWRSATRPAPTSAAPCPPPSAKPTTRNPGPKAATPTSTDGKLLCPFHHHRAHDPGWITHHHPNGSTTFTRRQ